MSDIAIRVDNLGKMYRIGAREKQPQGRWQAIKGLASSPFGYLQRMMRPPTAEETLWALRNVSFEVKRGEVIGIIGRNGAGKSTLLKILARITDPSEGRAEIHGRIGSLLEVGTGFHPELTGRENIYLNGAILGMKRAEIARKFDEIVAFSEVEQFLDTPVKFYSSGMYVRLAFAVAAHLEPEILLVDEVLAVGDAAFQKKALGKMGDVVHEGRTVLFVSHNMASIRSLCKRGLVVDKGSVQLDSSADAAVAEYTDRLNPNVLRHTVTLPRPDGLAAWATTLTLLCNGEPSAKVRMGDRLALRVRFAADRAIACPSVGFVISSAQGDPIINANNIYQPFTPMPFPARGGVITCSMGTLPLMEDKYTITLWFGADQEREHQRVDNCLMFEVSEYDAWGKGKLPTKRISALWWPTIFEVAATSEEA